MSKRFSYNAAGNITFGDEVYTQSSLGTTQRGLDRAEAFSAWLNTCLDSTAQESGTIRADQLWDIAHALQAALSRLLDSQRGMNLKEWQAATAQGRDALAKANDAEPE